MQRACRGGLGVEASRRWRWSIDRDGNEIVLHVDAVFQSLAWGLQIQLRPQTHPLLTGHSNATESATNSMRMNAPQRKQDHAARVAWTMLLPSAT